jgi:hypothetical protein
MLVVILLSALLFGNLLAVKADDGGDNNGPGNAGPLEPIEIIDAAFRDLSAQLHRPLGADITVYRWKLDTFLNTDLNCRTPGKVLPRQHTEGFSIWISVAFGRRTKAYIYRSTKDGTVLFQCTRNGPGPLIKVPGAPLPDLTYTIKLKDQQQGTGVQGITDQAATPTP